MDCHTHTHTHARIQKFILPTVPVFCPPTHTYTCTHIHTHTYTHIHTHTYTHTHTHTHIHTHTYTYIHIHTYTHIHTHTPPKPQAFADSESADFGGTKPAEGESAGWKAAAYNRKAKDTELMHARRELKRMEHMEVWSGIKVRVRVRIGC